MTVTDTTTSRPAPEDIRSYLIDRVAFYLHVPVTDIELDVPVTEYGLDSVYAVALCADIEDDLQVTVEPTLLWDVDTIAALTTHLTDLMAQPR